MICTSLNAFFFGTSDSCHGLKSSWMSLSTESELELESCLLLYKHIDTGTQMALYMQVERRDQRIDDLLKESSGLLMANLPTAQPPLDPMLPCKVLRAPKTSQLSGQPKDGEGQDTDCERQSDV